MGKIIFDEFETSKQLLENGFSGEDKFFSFREALLVGRRFHFVDGLGATRLEKELLKFIHKYDEYFNEIIYGDKLKKLVRWSMKYELHKTEPISITKSELETLRLVEDIENRRILFAILFLAKVAKQRSSSTDPRYFLNTKYISQIKEIAHIRGNCKYDSLIYEIIKSGVIEINMHHFRDESVNSYVLNFTDINKQNDIAFTITDFENIIDQLPDFCPRCHDPIYNNVGRRTEFCDLCYEVTRREKVRKNVQNFRQKHKGKNLLIKNNSENLFLTN
jgi:hypothetical protein